MKNIQFHLTLLFLFLISLAIAAMGILFFRYEKESLLRVQDKRTKLLVQNLAAHAVNAMAFDNITDLSARCIELAKDDNITQAMIIDTTGRIVAHNNPELIGKRIKSSKRLTELHSRFVDVKPYKSNTSNLYRYSTPVIDMQEKVGIARIVTSNKKTYGKLIIIGRKWLIFSLCSICISLVIFLIVIRLIVIKPIHRLSKSVQAAMAGNYNQPVIEKINNEIGNVTELFNSFIKTLLEQKNHFHKLFTTIQTFDIHREKTHLVSQLSRNLNDIISPSQCIIALVENNTLTIKNITGFDSEISLMGHQLVLPNEEFLKIFQKQVSQIFPTSAFIDTFEKLDIANQLTEEEALISPIIHNNKSKGIIMLLGKTDQISYSEADHISLDIISIATALSLFHIDLMEKYRKKKLTQSESYTADLMRGNLLPQKLIKMDGIETCSLYKPAGETHGNWYGFIENQDKRQLSVFIGDAIGSGMQAVLVTATANNFLKTIEQFVTRHENRQKFLPVDSSSDSGHESYNLLCDPAYLLSVLNHIIYSNSHGKKTMTLFASTIDLKNKRIFFANAGHEIPVLIQKKDNSPQALAASGPCLGDTETVHYDGHSLEIESGDVIIWYTLGLTQCTNTDNEQFGKMRLLSSLKKNSLLSSREICKNITHDVFGFKINSKLKDDITLVTAKIQ